LVLFIPFTDKYYEKWIWYFVYTKKGHRETVNPIIPFSGTAFHLSFAARTN